MEFYDAHAHCIQQQCGGFLIGLEGEPHFDGVMNNSDVYTYANISSFVGAYYISSSFDDVKNEAVLKYHPRREKYTAERVIKDLKRRNCRICIIDTLNQPFWSYMDYWSIVSEFPNIIFLLSHSGGYDILEFLKILDFNRNVYMDFSMTQEYFGWCGHRAELKTVSEAIDYCLNSEKLHHRILFGSDEPFFSQETAVKKYMTYKYADDILINNFKSLITNI